MEATKLPPTMAACEITVDSTGTAWMRTERGTHIHLGTLADGAWEPTDHSRDWDLLVYLDCDVEALVRRAPTRG